MGQVQVIPSEPNTGYSKLDKRLNLEYQIIKGKLNQTEVKI